MEQRDPKELLHRLSDLITTTKESDVGGMLRAFDASLNFLSSRVALTKAADWFLKNRTVDGPPDPNDDFWASRVSPDAAKELEQLIPRIVVLSAEHRHCSLMGNSAAMWAYSTFVILPEPADESLQSQLLDQLFEEVLSRKRAFDFRPEQICFQAYHRAPEKSLAVRFEHEFPDVRLGHCMMRLEMDSQEAVLYWPQIDDEEYNFVDLEFLTETCESLGLQHVLPMQLAAFLSVIGYATVDHTDAWGGKDGLFFFEEGNLPFVLRHLNGGQD